MSETYFITKDCKNCGKENKITIPKGTKIIDFLKENKKCFYCGCNLEEENE
jgi:hypothetical protein